MKKQNIKLMCLAGVFTALVFVFTAYLHIPSYTGYVHVGDGLIYIAAALLPAPYAVFVGAGGAFLADCLTGYAIWAPGSVIIKTAIALLFTNKSEKIIGKRNSLMLIPACGITVLGYYLYNAIVISGNFIAPVQEMPGNVVQSVFSSVLFVVVGFAFDKLQVKQKLI